MRPALGLLALGLGALLGACAGPSARDAGLADAGELDAGPPDAGRPDAGSHPDAGHRPDAGPADAGFDAGPPPDSGPPDIPAPGPLVLPYLGGPVLTGAHLVTIDYQDFPFDAELNALGDFLPGSAWLQATATPYGAGLSGHSHYTLPGNTPTGLKMVDLFALVEQGIDAGWWPERPEDGGAEALWMFLLPQGVWPDWSYAEHGYQAWDGGRRVVGYATGASDPPQVSEYEASVSHEVIEALTDPIWDAAPAYRGELNALFDGFSGPGETEVADICPGTVEEGGHHLSRAWSNAASLDGGDPCQPALDAWGMLRGPAGAITAGRGSVFQVPLTGVASDPALRWNIEVAIGEGGPLQPSLDVSSLGAGETALLTLHVPDDPYTWGPWFVRIDSSFDGGSAFCAIEVRQR